MECGPAELRQSRLGVPAPPHPSGEQGELFVLRCLREAGILCVFRVQVCRLGVRAFLDHAQRRRYALPTDVARHLGGGQLLKGVFLSLTRLCLGDRRQYVVLGEAGQVQGQGEGECVQGSRGLGAAGAQPERVLRLSRRHPRGSPGL